MKWKNLACQNISNITKTFPKNVQEALFKKAFIGVHYLLSASAVYGTKEALNKS